MNKKLISILLSVVALAIAYWTFDWAIGAVIHSRKVVIVPDLVGKSVSDALNVLGTARLGLEKEGEQFDKRFPAGTVVHQAPPAGMMVREGRIIRIMVSQGGETLFVPNLIGQPLRNAQTMLQNFGLSIGEVEHRPSLRYEKDQVMASDPPAAAIIAKNGLVSVILSEGPPGADVLLTPDWVGQTLGKAKEWADSHQMTVLVREESDLGKPEGEILLQSPTSDTPIRTGDALTLVVNRPLGSSPDQGLRVYYEVPQGASDRDIRILLIDEEGEREVFRKSQSPGSKIDFRVQPKGRARARVFVNGVMVEEQPLR